MVTYAKVCKKGELSLSSIIEEAKKSPEFQKAGAIALFIGVVRGENQKGEKVQKLELEAYEEKANEVLTSICEELKKKDGITNVQIYHLLGEFNAGEEMVYVLVAGNHRHNVFPVLQEAVERYKQEAPIFKKEYSIGKDGKKHDYWVEEHF